MSKATLGIDVAKLTLDVAWPTRDKTLYKQVENSARGFQALQAGSFLSRGRPYTPVWKPPALREMLWPFFTREGLSCFPRQPFAHQGGRGGEITTQQNRSDPYMFDRRV